MNTPNSEEFRKYATKHMGISSLTLDKYTSAISNVPVGMTPNIIEERQMNIAVMDVFKGARFFANIVRVMLSNLKE